MPETFSRADAALAEMGTLVGIPGLKFDAAGCCDLVFDNRCRMTLICAPSVQRLLLSCPLASAHTPIGGNAQYAMLRANFMGGGCGGGSLAMSPDGRPCLQFQLPYAELGGQALLSCIESLLVHVDTWAERLQRGEDGRTSAREKQSVRGLEEGERPPS